MQSYFPKLKNINWLLILIFFCAVALSIYFFSFNRPLWLDECYLALNLIEKINYFTLLDYNQAAPPLFMYASKFMYLLFGKTDYSLRIIPLLSYIFSLPLLFLVSKKILQSNVSRIIALIVYAFNYRILYYAEEFKQYSSDVLILLFIITNYLYIDFDKLNLKHKILYASISAILIWFSNVAAIAILTVGIIQLYRLIKGNYEIKNYIIQFLPSLLSVILYYLIMHTTINNPVLKQFWQIGFINNDFHNFINLLIDNMSFYFQIPVISLIFIITGIIVCIYKKKFVIIVPLFITMLLAYFKIYPFSGRLILFLVPVFALLIASVTDFENKILKYILTIIIVIFVFIPNYIYTRNMIIYKRYYHEEILTPLITANKLMRKNDKLIVDGNNKVCFKYYEKFYTSDKNSVIFTSDNLNEFIKELHNLKKGNYFYIFSHYRDRKQWLTEVTKFVKAQKYSKIYSDIHGNSLFIFTIF